MSAATGTSSAGASTGGAPSSHLTVRTRAVADSMPELDVPFSEEPTVAWRRGRDGLLGWGQAARITLYGPDRFRVARDWWRALLARATVDDDVRRPGSGPVAFAAFTFADGPSATVVVVPRVVVGHSGDTAWRTEVRGGDDLPSPPTTDRGPHVVELADASMDAGSWEAAAVRVIDRIRDGEARKVVFTRDVLAVADRPFDLGRLLARSLSHYPQCWSFLVDGLVGATPELLVRRRGAVVRSRVLAGTAWPTAGHRAADPSGLLASVKNRVEHRYAIDSVVDALRTRCTTVQAPDTPGVLALPDLSHLRSDVLGLLPETDRPSLFDLAAALHPSAAIGGHPTPAALDLITEFEGMDRARYTGPVGWIDRHGDGDLGIALRCAQIDGAEARMFAGGGLVADSDPRTELIETDVKLRAMRTVLAV